MLKFTANDIDAIFNGVVDSYMNKGYEFRPMMLPKNGIYSDVITYLDLYSHKDKDNSIRIWLLTSSEHIDNNPFIHSDTLNIRVTKHKVNDHSKWPDKGSIIEEYKFYVISDYRHKCYTDSIDEFKAINELRMQRYDINHINDHDIVPKYASKVIDLTKVPSNIIDGILKRVRQVAGFKRAKAYNIDRITLQRDYDSNHLKATVNCKLNNKTITLVLK